MKACRAALSGSRSSTNVCGSYSESIPCSSNARALLLGVGEPRLRGASHRVTYDAPDVVSTKQVTSYELEERTTEAPNLVVVDVTGELDLTNAQAVEERLEDLAADAGPALVLDLNRVLFIDSAAIHVLFRAARRLGKERFGLVFEPTSAVARTLEIVAISKVAAVAASHEDLPPFSPP